jgi:hypothetical protein
MLALLPDGFFEYVLKGVLIYEVNQSDDVIYSEEDG